MFNLLFDMIGLGSVLMLILFCSTWILFDKYMEEDEIFPFENRLRNGIKLYILKISWQMVANKSK